MAYENKDSLSEHRDSFLVGVLSQNIFYMKKGLITGGTGQDGCYLAKLLLSKGYKVYGAQRRNTGKRYWRLDELNNTEHIES